MVVETLRACSSGSGPSETTQAAKAAVMTTRTKASDAAIRKTTAPPPTAVMAGLVPAIHVFRILSKKTWMPGTSPGMTTERCWFSSFAHFAGRTSTVPVPVRP